MGSAQLREAGFSDDEVNEYVQLESAGFSEGEIESYYSGKSKVEPPKRKEKSFASRTFDNIGEAWEEATTPIQSKGEFLDSVPGFPILEKTAAVMAPLGRTVIDAALTGAKGLYNLTTSPYTRENVSAIADSLSKNEGVKMGGMILKDAYETAKEKAPRGMKFAGDVMEASNIIPMVPLVKAGIEMLPKIGAKTLDDVVKYGFKKGIKPSVEGKSDAGLTEKFYANAKTATKEIVERFPDDIPKDVEGFSQKVRQAKKDIWSESSGMAEAAGEKGAASSVTPLRSEMQTVVDAPNVPKSAKVSAQKVLDEIESYGSEITPVEAEELIAHFNSRSKPFWNDPNPNKLDDAVFNERAANILRKTTDKSIETYEGPGWQDLRKRYGAQSAIEKAVNNRANVTARRNVKGFFDLTDVFSTGEFVAGLLTMNPAQIAKAATMHGVKKYINKVNNPDNIIKKMFKDTKKIVDEGKAGREAVKESVFPSYPVPDEIPMQPPRLSPQDVDAMIPYYNAMSKDLRTKRLPPGSDIPQIEFDRRAVPIGEAYNPDWLPVVSEATGEGFTSVPKAMTTGVSPMDMTRESLRPDIGWGPTKIAVSDLNYKTRTRPKQMTMTEAMKIFRESQKRY